MIKRLLITALALTIIAILCGTAVADIGKGPLNAVRKIDPTNPRLGELQQAGPIQPATRKPVSDFKLAPEGLSVPASPIDYFCEIEDFTNGTVSYY